MNDVPQGDGTPVLQGHHSDKRDGSVPTGRHFGAIAYGDERPEQWANPGDAWLHGYWTWDWAESTQRIENLNTKTNQIPY